MLKDELIKKLVQQKHNRMSKLNINKYITIFESLYHTHSLIETATQLNMNISTISICLNNLENLIGENLFTRHGRNGIEITNTGHNFHAISSIITRNFEQLADNFIVKQKSSQKTSTNIIRIFCNNLMANYYLINIIQNLNITKLKYSLYIEIGDRDEGLAKLQNKETDLVIFPMEWRDLASFKNNFIIQNIKPYHLQLFMNKKHPLANMYEDSITWQDLGEMHIMPINEKTRLNTAQNMLRNINDKYITTSTDLMFLYQGIVKNLWSICIGDEFSKLFDCTNLTIKQQAKATNVQFSIFWFAIYNEDKPQNTVQIIKQIIEQIKQI